MKNLSTRNLTRFALVTAMYVVLTQTTLELAYGPLQFRVSEVLTLLAFIDPFYVAPLTLACAIVNFLSPFGLIDVIFGTLASFLALYGMTKVKNLFVASLFPALSAVIIGLEIYLVSQEPVNFFLITGQIALSQFIIVSLIGVPIFKKIMDNTHLMEAIKTGDEDINTMNTI